MATSFPSDALKPLTKFFLQHFNAQELRSLVKCLSKAGDLINCLPADMVAYSTLVEAVAEGLNRRGAIDSQLFSQLLVVRPGFSDEIQHISAGLGLKDSFAYARWLPSGRFNRARYPFVQRPAKRRVADGAESADAIELLDKMLVPRLPDQTAMAPRVVSICGAKGVGKSALAEYWASLRFGAFNCILWVDAGTTSGGRSATVQDPATMPTAQRALRIAFIEAAARSKLIEPVEGADLDESKLEALVDLVRGSLVARGDTLIIFDDLDLQLLDGDEDYAGVLPRLGQIDAIITTSTEGHLCSIYLDDLSSMPDAAARIILQGQTAPETSEDREAALELGAACGWLPLGLSVVARMLADGVAQNVEELWSSIKGASLSTEFVRIGHFQPLVAALDAICLGEGDIPGQTGEELLRLLSAFEPGQPLGRSTIDIVLAPPSGQGRKKTEMLSQAIDRLVRRGLLVRPGRHTVRVPTLIQTLALGHYGLVGPRPQILLVNRLFESLHPLNPRARSAQIRQDPMLASQIMYLCESVLEVWLAPVSANEESRERLLALCSFALLAGKRVAHYCIASARRREVLTILSRNESMWLWEARLRDLHADLLLNERVVKTHTHRQEHANMRDEAERCIRRCFALLDAHDGQAVVEARIVRANALMTLANLSTTNALGYAEQARSLLADLADRAPLDRANANQLWARLAGTPAPSRSVQTMVEVERALEEAYALQRDADGDDSDVVGVLCDLCTAITTWCSMVGDESHRAALACKAVQWGELAVKEGEARLGRAHVVTANAYTRRALAYLEASKLEADKLKIALSSAKRGVELRRQYISVTSTSYAGALMNLALIRNEMATRESSNRDMTPTWRKLVKEYGQAASIYEHAKAPQFYMIARLDQLRAQNQVAPLNVSAGEEAIELYDAVVSMYGDSSAYAARNRSFVAGIKEKVLPLSI